MKYHVLILSMFFLAGCKSDSNHNIEKRSLDEQNIKPILSITNTSERIIGSLPTPEGYEPISTEQGSYAYYFQNLPLKPKGSQIKYFDGRVKSYFMDYTAVLDLPIGDKDLHQCADAVMRLRADYFWNNKQFDKIHFNFTNGMRVEYTNWMKGQRIKVNGNNTSWYQKKIASNTEKDYWEYLEQIWMYAGTLSLSKELSARNIEDVEIGDVFIQGGTPGHAITVINIAEHNSNGNRLILLAQSYMPAQEIHILTNPNDTHLSPWYSIKDLDQLSTPEWTFSTDDLMYFKN